jgi:cyclophilin family peptidyl-prolyl cis-trans isomerase
MRFRIPAFSLAAALLLAAQTPTAQRADGLYAEIRTNKGLIVVRLEPELTPIAVANFVGLAEGTIANAAFDPGRPFFDGTVYHRVVPGHVIQTGSPQGGRANNTGYTFPNEVYAGLSHNHAGALNMANAGPGTNSSQFCIMLGDRRYLDGDFTVFGDTVEGLDVVMRIVQGDVVQTVRIVRVGAKAQSFHPTTESFMAMVKTAKERATEEVEKKRVAEREWVGTNYPKATGPDGGVLTEQLAPGTAAAAAGPLRVRYHGNKVRYVGDVLGRTGPPMEATAFQSGENGVPGIYETPQVFTYEPGKTKLNPGLDGVLAKMQPGERRIVVVPPALAYGRAGTYPPETPGKPRFVISPNMLLVYDVEVLADAGR